MTALSPTPSYGDAAALTRPAEAAALELAAQGGTASPSVMVQNLGIAVRQLREKRGWSQEELAERSGLNRSYVGEIERGKVVASVVTAHKLAHALSVSIVDLFTQSDAIARMRSRLWKQ